MVAAVSTLVVSVVSPLRDLISLGLYLNAANEHIPPPPSIEEELQQAVPEKVEFASLRKLTVWFSSLSSPVPLAVYLSSVLPPGCVLISGSYGELRPEDPGKKPNGLFLCSSKCEPKRCELVYCVVAAMLSLVDPDQFTDDHHRQSLAVPRFIFIFYLYWCCSY